jgi:hypothetical protein
VAVVVENHSCFLQKETSGRHTTYSRLIASDGLKLLPDNHNGTRIAEASVVNALGAQIRILLGSLSQLN